MKEWLLPALGAVIFWGIWGFIPKITADSISPQSFLFYQVLGGLIVVVLFGFKSDLDIDPKGSLLAIVAGAANFLALFFYVKALSKGQVSIISTITALYPIVVILLAFFLLQESLTWKQGIGLGLGLAAIALFAS